MAIETTYRSGGRLWKARRGMAWRKEETWNDRTCDRPTNQHCRVWLQSCGSAVRTDWPIYDFSCTGQSTWMLSRILRSRVVGRLSWRKHTTLDPLSGHHSPSFLSEGNVDLSTPISVPPSLDVSQVVWSKILDSVSVASNLTGNGLTYQPGLHTRTPPLGQHWSKRELYWFHVYRQYRSARKELKFCMRLGFLTGLKCSAFSSSTCLHICSAKTRTYVSAQFSKTRFI